MAGSRIELKGADEARSKLGEAISRTERPRDLYDAIGAMLTTSTDRRFEDEKAPDDSPWPQSVRALLEGGKTLTDTSLLRGSITWEATDTGVAVGTNVIYAAIHQMGGTIRPRAAGALRFQIGGAWVNVKSVTMPKRAFLGISKEDEAELLGLAGDWLLAPMGGPGSAAGMVEGINA